MKRNLFGVTLLCIGATAILSGCSSKKHSGGTSDKTGWDYNDPKLGGFERANYPGQQVGPGLTFVEGGRFTMGQTEDDLPTVDANNRPRTVSVSSFYMDETEVANIHYREYTYWMTRAYNNDYPELVQKCLPDETVWRQNLSYNEPFVEYYFKHAAYNYYPVVGVNWSQANDYCKWRSDRVNEYILIKNGMLNKNPNEVNEDIYNNETYTNGKYEGAVGRNRKRDLDPSGSGKRNTKYDDGYLLPNYRLPTEAEWEYAALGLIGNNPEPETKRRRGEEVLVERNNYPWGAKNTTRYGLRNEYQGEFLANFKRGKGDNMGVTGGLNDNADIPAPVYSYKPNAFGLYNMAGNVSEWTLDTYRPTYEGLDDFRPFRGNVYTAIKTNPEDFTKEDPDSIGHYDLVPDTTMIGRVSPYFAPTKSTDVRDYNDGDSLSNYTYDPKNTLVNNDSKVIKGASWADRAYWLSPGTRRFMQANQSSATVGFRCVMDRLGSPNGDNSETGGNHFGKDKNRR